jgi:hypothetical protein
LGHDLLKLFDCPATGLPDYGLRKIQDEQSKKQHTMKMHQRSMLVKEISYVKQTNTIGV